jgi:hypothetical protein
VVHIFAVHRIERIFVTGAGRVDIGGRRTARRNGTARAAAVALVIGTLAGGCDGARSSEPDPTRTALSPMEFVDAVVAVRRAEQEAKYQDSAAVVFDSLKAAALAERGTTEEEIREFVRARSNDFDLMAEVWDSITQRLKYVPPRHDPAPMLPPPDSS